MNTEDRTPILVRLLTDRLQRDESRLCFLFGAGAVVPNVPGVQQIVKVAREWTTKGDVAAPSDDEDLRQGEPPRIGPEDYGRALDEVKLSSLADGQRAFIQWLALEAYGGANAGTVRDRLWSTSEPLSVDAFTELTNDLDGWKIPPGLEAFADLVARRNELPRTILTRTSIR